MAGGWSPGGPPAEGSPAVGGGTAESGEPAEFDEPAASGGVATSARPMDNREAVLSAAHELLKRVGEPSAVLYRLVGVGLSNFLSEEDDQGLLFKLE